MRTVSLNTFDGGVVNDPRDPRENVSRIVTNFDVLTDPHRMVPYHDSETGDSTPTVRQIQNYCVGYLSTTAKLFGLGVQSGTGFGEVFAKDLTVGGSNDLTDGGWTEPANNKTATSGGAAFILFVFYKTTGKVYFTKGSPATRVCVFDSVGGGAFQDDGSTGGSTNLTNAPTGQGIVHSKDDILYIPCGNLIAKNSNDTWTNNALTLPSKYTINSICEYGNYLAIAASPSANTGSARVFLWDRDSSLATLSESIDWGEGTIDVLEEISGTLVGISSSSGSSIRFKDRIIFKYYSGAGGAIPFLTLVGTSATTTLKITKQKIDQRVYFMMQMVLNGATRQGVWSIGRQYGSGAYSLIHEHTLNNDTNSTSNAALISFFIFGDFTFCSYLDSNGNNAVSKTNDQTSFTATSIYESTINPEQPERIRGSAGSRSKLKSLMAVALGMEPLSSGQQAVLKYKVDGGSYQTIGTFTNAVASDTPVAERTFDANGKQFQNGREYEFRIESTGGAIITELKYRYEELDTKL